jgi:hypothetical protein
MICDLNSAWEMRSEVFEEVKMSIVVFWVVAACDLVGRVGNGGRRG